MGMGGGGKSTTSETKEVRLPAWVEAASQENYQRAKDVANRPYAANPYELQLAGLDPMYYAARKDIGALNDYYGNYKAASSGLKGLMGYNPADINASTVGVESLAGKDLSPYLNPWIDTVEARSIDNATRAGLKEQGRIATDATKKGSLGGSRMAVQQGVQGAETARQVGDISANLRKEGFQQAQTAAIGDIQREYAAAVQRGDWAQAAQIASRQHDLEANQQRIAAAAGLTSTADAAQAAKMNEMAAKLGIGQMAQQQKQAGIDKKSGAWQKKRDYPLEQLNILLAALGMSPYGHTETSTSTTKQSGGGGDIFGSILGGGKLLMGLMGASDPAMKTNIEPVGKTAGGLPLYAYDYIADVEEAKRKGKAMGPKRVGPMATDLPNVKLKGRKGRRIIDLTDFAHAA
jgi:hypothetical protein